MDGAGGDAEWKDSVKEATRNLITAIKNAPKLPPPPEPTSIEILLQWMKPVRCSILIKFCSMTKISLLTSLFDYLIKNMFYV